MIPKDEVKVIASGSKGNCTAVTIGKAIILLDAGIKFGRIQEALNFENPLAALITHEHGDHAKLSTINELLTRGVNVYMSKGTAEALKLEARHNLFIVKPDTKICIQEPPADLLQDRNYWQKQIICWVHSAVHDAAEPLGFEIFPQHVSYFIDTNELTSMARHTAPNILLIECNHDEQVLRDADIDQSQKQRILHNHFSLQQVLEYVVPIAENRYVNWFTEIHLLHISKRHGNAELFRQKVQDAVGDKIKVFAY